jgi:mono/diheme cytochrome c family protein
MRVSSVRNLLVLPLAVAMLVGFSGLAAADGKAVFGAKKCGGCHKMKAPPTDKTIYDVWKRKGPELWYSGDKFLAGFLEGWLQDPKPIRAMEFYSLTEKNKGDHPKLSAKDAKEVAVYLMTLKSGKVKAGSVKIKKKNLKGKLLFSKKQSCFGCHTYMLKKKLKGGLSGPDLSTGGARLNPDWVYAYLADPEVFKSVKAMPQYKGILKDKEMRNLAGFIATMK